MNTDPEPTESPSEPLNGDLWQEMSKRAKVIAKEIEEKVRKATGETPVGGTPAVDDSTDELPPLTDEAPPLR